MNKKKCEVCGSSHTVKNGIRKGVQLYKCQDCGHQFRAGTNISEDVLWDAYQQEKQTIKELSERFGMSIATVKRRLHDIKREWVHPSLSGSGFLHLDTTYWGRSFGVLLALDHVTGKPLYIAFVKSETTKDYEDAVQSVKERGYNIDGIIIDGKQSLFRSFAEYPIQMCQFHMKQIIKRYLTKNPKLLAARALNALVDKLTRSDESAFKAEFAAWKEEWRDMIGRRSIYKNGSSHYTHQRLRSAMHSLDFYMPYLFTYQREDCKGMPNTNNKIEGTFTDLKKNLNNHSGLTKENRKRFISGFFLALNNELQL
jgi:transposase-like protein